MPIESGMSIGEAFAILFGVCGLLIVLIALLKR